MKKTKVLFWQLSNKGFGAEINNLIYAINYSIDKNYVFSLDSFTWNFKVKKGWLDYFDSLHNEHNENKNKLIQNLIRIVDKYIGLIKIINYNSNVKNGYYIDSFNGKRNFNSKVVFFYIIKNLFFICKPRNVEIMMDNFYKVRNYNIELSQKDNRDFVIRMNKILKEIWKIKPCVLEKIEDLKIDIESDYAVFHIRRGDKLTTGEDVLYDEKDYMGRFVDLESGIKTVFVMSDDYSVFVVLKKLFPSFNFVTLISPSEKGHNQADFNKKSDLKKEMSALNLLTELEVARNSKIFIGSRKSNLFRLVEYFKIDGCFDISKSNQCDYII